MKNKGFTIIELLSVLFILGLVGTIVTVSLTNTMKGVKENGCSDFVGRIEEGACVYSTVTKNCPKTVCTPSQVGFFTGKGISNVKNSNFCCEVSLETLVQNGYVKEEKDACTETELDLSKKVIVVWKDNGEKICKYDGVDKYAK